MTDLLLLAAVLAAAAVAARVWRLRRGQTVAAAGSLSAGARETVGAPPGRSTLLLFTSPTCGGCAAARQVLESVAAQRPSLEVAEVDVSAEWEVARQAGVLRAPTVLVVDAAGAIRARVSGVPDPERLAEALPSREK